MNSNSNFVCNETGPSSGHQTCRKTILFFSVALEKKLAKKHVGKLSN